MVKDAIESPMWETSLTSQAIAAAHVRMYVRAEDESWPGESRWCVLRVKLRRQIEAVHVHQWKLRGK